MRFNPFISAAVLAMVLAFGLALRVLSQNSGFHQVVKESLATSEGYDQKFIDLVDHLEEVLATRASFAYPGGRDPMTGRRREVAMPIASSMPSPRRATATKAAAKSGTAKPDSAKAPEPAVDLVKLTAIIADDYGQHTAIVMNGERSLSVDVGDMVGTRKVVKITSKEVSMENDSAVYSYDISGNRSLQRK